MSDDAGQRDEGSAVIEVPPKKAPKPSEPKQDKLPPFNVLLHNDDHNDMLDVVDAICEITPHKRGKAVEIMMLAHTRGLALVLTTHKERAELYQDQFKTKKLVVTIEPAE